MQNMAALGGSDGYLDGFMRITQNAVLDLCCPLSLAISREDRHFIFIALKNCTVTSLDLSQEMRSFAREHCLFEQFDDVCKQYAVSVRQLLAVFHTTSKTVSLSMVCSTTNLDEGIA